ncbi:sodium ion-translocating decarboxylase subunit beta [Tepidimicrobium xylanilyticum]
MWIIGGILIYLAIKKDMEPTLLLPIGFGTILVNLPSSGAVTQVIDGVKEIGIIDVLFDAGISNELFPLLLFIGIGAMIDFTPLLTNPKMLFFGAADGPTSIFVANYFNSNYIGAIVVAAYSYMALVPIIQPFVIKKLTTRKERFIRMEARREDVSKTAKILFPILVTIIAGIMAPKSVALIGFLMFGNLIRECGVLNSLSETAQNVLANLITIFLGITISTKMQAELFLTKETLMILCLGLIAFAFDTVGGVLFAKIINLFSKKKINPMVGAAGISAFPMSARVVHKMGLQEDPHNFLLMHAVGANVAGQIGSVIAGGFIINLVSKIL